ncbi:MAG: ComF family protein [Endomicrobium sp.]|nr:ComF family protein [Endomicrobium sp.]
MCGSELHPLSQTRICTECKELLPLIRGFTCQKCGAPLSYDVGFCYTCKKYYKEYSFEKMRSVYLYTGSLRKLILKFKYSNRYFLSKDFGLAMYETIKLYGFCNNVDFIIPVPLNIIRRIRRGYNQAELLASVVSVKTNIPMLKNILFRKKITKPQFNLSRTDRMANIKDSFFVKNDKIIKDKVILLIDDIVTTFSTVLTCSLALKTSGAQKVYVLALARD